MLEHKVHGKSGLYQLEERISLHIIGASSFYQLYHFSQSRGDAFHKILFSELLLLETTLLLVTSGKLSCDYIDTKKEV